MRELYGNHSKGSWYRRRLGAAVVLLEFEEEGAVNMSVIETAVR